MKKHFLSIALLSAFAGPATAATFLAQFVGVSSAPGAPPSVPAPAPGLYFGVMEGLIVVSNAAGTLNVAAGQFGYVSTSLVPPVPVPAANNSAVQFTPRPSFNPPSFQPSSKQGSEGEAKAVDCEVR